MNQNYDGQIQSTTIHQLEENMQFHDFLNYVQRNEAIKTKEPEMFGNMNEDREIIEEPEKCTICLDII